jgi:hypothetical protein
VLANIIAGVEAIDKLMDEVTSHWTDMDIKALLVGARSLSRCRCFVSRFVCCHPSISLTVAAASLTSHTDMDPFMRRYFQRNPDRPLFTVDSDIARYRELQSVFQNEGVSHSLCCYVVVVPGSFPSSTRRH